MSYIKIKIFVFLALFTGLFSGLFVQPLMAATNDFIITPNNTQNSEQGSIVRVGILSANSQHDEAYLAAGKLFEKENPSLKIQFSFYDDAGYKKALSKWLALGSGPDVLYWQAGIRLRHYAKQGLVRNLNEFWQENTLDGQFTAEIKQLVMLNDDIYGVPFAYYPWGIYYNKTLLDELGINSLDTWDDLLAACDKLNANQIVPFFIGTQQNFPAAAWFDFINLRLNGLDFHLDLMDGKIPFTDDRIRNVFVHWKVLIDRQCFIQSPEKYDWQEGLPLIYRRKAAMMLIGSFAEKQITKSLVDDIGLFRFPKIQTDMEFFEPAPAEIFMIPSYTKNIPAAEAFLAFVARSDIQATLNAGLGYIPPNLNSDIAPGELPATGAKILREAGGYSQYFDRDTVKLLGDLGLKAFSTFFNTGNIELSQQQLEITRQNAFPEFKKLVLPETANQTEPSE